jgi:hypothetical protein
MCAVFGAHLYPRWLPTETCGLQQCASTTCCTICKRGDPACFAGHNRLSGTQVRLSTTVVCKTTELCRVRSHSVQHKPGLIALPIPSGVSNGTAQQKAAVTCHHKTGSSLLQQYILGRQALAVKPRAPNELSPKLLICSKLTEPLHCAQCWRCRGLNTSRPLVRQLCELSGAK